VGRVGDRPVASATAKPTGPVKHATVAFPFGAEVVENQNLLLRLDDLVDELDPAIGMIRRLEVVEGEATDRHALDGLVDAVTDGECRIDVVR
jgi:hypothetical protein